MLHSFFGYSDAPTPLQLLVYVGYLAIVIIAYLGLRAGLRNEVRPGRALTAGSAGGREPDVLPPRRPGPRRRACARPRR